MIINPLTGQRIADKKNVDKTKSAAPNAFFDLLADQLLPPEAPACTTSTIAMEGTEERIPVELRLAGLSMSENTIDLLESFSEALANLHLTAQDLLPLIEALEGDTTTLLDIKDQLPPNDPLAMLIDRVTTVTVVEAQKFRRGDYN